MVSLELVQQSNAQIKTLPKRLVALFIGATSGIGQSALEHFAQNAPSTRIYSVARSSTVASHENHLASVRRLNSTATLNIITADISLISEVEKVVDTIKKQENKLDILFLSPGFLPFDGRENTREGLDPSMTTRYYSRLRAVQQLIPLLNQSPSPRIVSVLAGGMEAAINEQDLDLRDPSNWTWWSSSVHSATMGTLALERFARENPRISIVHSSPGAVDTPLLARAIKFGMSLPDPMSQDESGQRSIFLATSDRYAVQGGGLVPVIEGLEEAKRSGGGIYIVNPLGEVSDNETVLAGMREKGLDKTVWKFTEGVYASCVAQATS